MMGGLAKLIAKYPELAKFMKSMPAKAGGAVEGGMKLAGQGIQKASELAEEYPKAASAVGAGAAGLGLGLSMGGDETDDMSDEQLMAILKARGLL